MTRNMTTLEFIEGMSHVRHKTSENETRAQLQRLLPHTLSRRYYVYHVGALAYKTGPRPLRTPMVAPYRWPGARPDLSHQRGRISCDAGRASVARRLRRTNGVNVSCAVESIEDAPVDNRLLAAAQCIEDALRHDTSEDGTCRSKRHCAMRECRASKCGIKGLGICTPEHGCGFDALGLHERLCFAFDSLLEGVHIFRALERPQGPCGDKTRARSRRPWRLE